MQDKDWNHWSTFPLSEPTEHQICHFAGSAAAAGLGLLSSLTEMTSSLASLSLSLSPIPISVYSTELTVSLLTEKFRPALFRLTTTRGFPQRPGMTYSTDWLHVPLVSDNVIFSSFAASLLCVNALTNASRPLPVLFFPWTLCTAHFLIFFN